MALKPFDLGNVEIPAELNTVLIDAGLAKDVKSVTDKKQNLINARKVFDAAGAGLDNIASTISNIMQAGDTDNSKLKACDLALKVQGILEEIDEKHIPSINITVNSINSQDSKTLVNLVFPTT